MKATLRPRAFTLLELLMVISIISCLAALLMPALTTIRKKADSAACLANLRQIGIGGIVYAAEHNQTTPTIEPWPSQPVYGSSSGAQNILDALKPYGVTAEMLKCRSDLAGPNYYAREGSSYEWCPMANGQNVQAPKLIMPGNFGGADVPLSRLLMAFDYSNIHNEASNVLFGDGHVAPAN
jgi:prepilin-type N-terminal cleavage/methylation domain-containing protein/prepilin-type processing-associated H-X9-DG protein